MTPIFFSLSSPLTSFSTVSIYPHPTPFPALWAPLPFLLPSAWRPICTFPPPSLHCFPSTYIPHSSPPRALRPFLIHSFPLFLFLTPLFLFLHIFCAARYSSLTISPIIFFDYYYVLYKNNLIRKIELIFPSQHIIAQKQHSSSSFYFVYLQ